MPPQDADRNLLFGITALQNDFITRDALIAAMGAWALAKHRPIGEILVEANALEPGDRDALEAMLGRRLAKHGNDPAASLASISSAGTIVEDLRRAIADPEILASIAHIPADSEHDPHATRVPETIDYIPAGVRYRKVRNHAEGGLGIVFVAHDNELNREVALKEIKAKYAKHPGNQARFLTEAEITGGLEHPGIVPVYGLGHHEDGRPYYAMRFIRGDSLKDAIKAFHDDPVYQKEPGERTLALQKLLRRFLDVCNAVAYAHSRGVLHRDLKPDNVMVGRYGETLVVDWGLAKSVGRSGDDDYGPMPESTILYPSKSNTAETIPGSIVGTPGYMSPEQAAGRLDLLGPTSDVYSLGATLYSLLTGQKPFTGYDVGEILRKVERGDFPRLRVASPWLDPALEAVCLKAMALKPSDRYTSPRALAEDIERWLGDEPVDAYREPLTRRARRWAKRNRTAVIAASVAVLMGTIGLGAVAAVQTGARNDLADKNRELDRKNNELVVANKAIDEQRQRAEKNEAEAIAAVKKFGDVIANEPELKKSQALEPLRKRLLNEPLVYFKALCERLRADHDTTPESLERLASASFDLGFLTNDIGDRQNTMTAFREGLLIREKLADANPSNTALQIKLVSSYNLIGVHLNSNDHMPAEAMRYHQLAVEVLQRLANGDPSNVEFLTQLAYCQTLIALSQWMTFSRAEAVRTSQLVVQSRQKLVDANPSVAEYKAKLSESLTTTGFFQSSMGRTVEALQSHQSALQIRQMLVDANPLDAKALSALAITYQNIGINYKAIGQASEALKAMQSALKIQQELVDASPAEIRSQGGLAGIHKIIGEMLMTLHQPEEALRSLQSSLQIRQQLVDTNPSITQLKVDLGGCLNDIGMFLKDSGRFAEALKSYQSALQIRQGLAESNPTAASFRRDVGAVHNNIGGALDSSGQSEGALLAYKKAHSIFQTLVTEHPESIDFVHDDATTLRNIALIELTAKRFKEARDLLRGAIAHERRAFAANPRDPAMRKILPACWISLAEACRGLSDAEGVAEAERELAALRNSSPSPAALDARLSSILKGDQKPRDVGERLQLAQHAYDKGLHVAAAKIWGEAFEADAKSSDSRDPQNRYNAACAAALAGCGQGKDEPAPDEAAKTKLRRQALGWLSAEVVVWAMIVESGPPQAKDLIIQTLDHWKKDTDLAGIRDEASLSKLPGDERDAFRKLWSDVEALRLKVGGK